MKKIAMAILILLAVPIMANAVEFRLYKATDGVVVFLNLEGSNPANVAALPPAGLSLDNITGWGITIWDVPNPIWTLRFAQTGSIPATGWVWMKLRSDQINVAQLADAKWVPFFVHEGADIYFNTFGLPATFNSNIQEPIPDDGNFPFSPAELSVVQSPVINTQPESLTLAIGSQAQFAVAATSATPLNPTFQWKKDGVAIDGKTDSQYIITAVQTTDAGQYSCEVTDPIGTVTSQIATLTVTEGPPPPPPPPPTDTTADIAITTHGLMTTIMTDDIRKIFPGITASSIRRIGYIFKVWDDETQSLIDRMVTTQIEVTGLPIQFTIEPPQRLDMKLKLVAITKDGQPVLAGLANIHGRLLNSPPLFNGAVDQLPVVNGYWEFEIPAQPLPISILGQALIVLLIIFFANKWLTRATGPRRN